MKISFAAVFTAEADVIRDAALLAARFGMTRAEMMASVRVALQRPIAPVVANNDNEN